MRQGMSGSATSAHSIEIRREPGRVAYRDALDAMTARNAAIADGSARELLWLLEHPPVYTIGRLRDQSSLRNPACLAHPVHAPGAVVLPDDHKIEGLNEAGRKAQEKIMAITERLERVANMMETRSRAKTFAFNVAFAREFAME